MQQPGISIVRTLLGTSATWAGLFWISAGLSPASAHSSAGSVSGFASGFMHPLLGPDHLVAMVAVGLWGCFLGAPAIWMLPLVFPIVMAFGGVLGIIGVPVPHVEVGIALSAFLLGLMVALAAKPPIIVAALIVGAFAVFHGHAHGSELPQAADPLLYSAGFVLATGLLHLAGIGLGLLARRPLGAALVRATGAAIAVAGLVFLAGQYPA